MYVYIYIYIYIYIFISYNHLSSLTSSASSVVISSSDLPSCEAKMPLSKFRNNLDSLAVSGRR